MYAKVKEVCSSSCCCCYARTHARIKSQRVRFSRTRTHKKNY